MLSELGDAWIPLLMKWIVPGFVLAMLLERVVMRARGARGFEWAESWSNFFCGMFSQVADLLLLPVVLGTCAWVGDRWSLVQLPRTPLVFVALMIALDFLHYWQHRWSHRNRWLWAVHHSHHSSPLFDLTVGFRVPGFARVTLFPVYLVLVLAGFPAYWVFLAEIAHACYQFINHTNAVEHWGVPGLRYVVVTPGHHRLHHGIEAEYGDANFALMFSFWDRLFGTYAVESRPVTYGVRASRPMLDPVAANVLPAFENLRPAPQVDQVGPIRMRADRKMRAIVLLALVFAALVALLAFAKTTATPGLVGCALGGFALLSLAGKILDWSVGRQLSNS